MAVTLRRADFVAARPDGAISDIIAACLTQLFCCSALNRDLTAANIDLTAIKMPPLNNKGLQFV
jgi:hypothetical protein